MTLDKLSRTHLHLDNKKKDHAVNATLDFLARLVGFEPTTYGLEVFIPARRNLLESLTFLKSLENSDGEIRAKEATEDNFAISPIIFQQNSIAFYRTQIKVSTGNKVVSISDNHA